MASEYDIAIDQGATYRLRLTYNDPNGSPINLTGMSARMDIRTNIGGTLILALRSPSSGITLGGAAGTIDIELTADQTALLTKNAVYDLELVNGSEVTRIVQGSVTLDFEVTTGT